MSNKNRENFGEPNHTAASVKDLPRLDRRIAIVLWGVAGILTWLSLVYLPKDVLGPEVMDPSLQGSLSYFATKKMQFGPEIMFTYGPTGYLIPEIYDGLLFEQKLVVELISKIFITAVVLCVAGKLAAFRRAFFFAAVWVICSRFGHAYPEVLFYFCIASLLPIVVVDDGRKKPFIIAGSLLFLAFVSLIKFTLLTYCALAVAAVTVCFACRKKWKAAALFPSAYVILLFLIWVTTGQRLVNFAIWIKTSLEIVGGYTQCMGLESAPGILPLAICVLVTAVVLLAMSIFGLRRNIVACLTLLTLAGGYWVSWKHGLVRADDHVYLFFGFSLLTFIAFPVFVTKSCFGSWPPAALATLASVLCVAGMYVQDAGFVIGAPHRALIDLLENASRLSSLSSCRNELQTKLNVEKTRSECPQIKAQVGNATVDMFGYNQAIVLLNDLNYHPRPVFQSYGTYTPALIRANANFYRSEDAPTYVISSLATVDDHFPTEDDPEALRVLLVDYDFMFAEKGWTLWKRSSFVKARAEELTETTTTNIRPGQTVNVAGNDVWCAIDFAENWRTKIRNFFYKPTPLFIAFVDEGQHRSLFRVLPTVARTGFILDPLLLTDFDIVGLKTNLAPAPKHVVSFELVMSEKSRKYFADSITIHLSSIPSLSSRGGRQSGPASTSP